MTLSLLQIYEATEKRDFDYRKEAIKIAKKLARIVDGRKRKIKDFIVKNEDKLKYSKTTGYKIFGVEIAKKYGGFMTDKFNFLLIDKDFKKYSALWPDDPKKPITIVLSVLDIDNKKVLDTNTWQGTTVHEIVHYLDSQRIRLKSPRYSPKSGEFHAAKKMKKYFNDPIEFNAYYQEGVSWIDRNVKRYSNASKEWLAQVSWDGFYSYYVKEHSFFRANFLKNMNTKYRRKFLQRFHMYYKELQKRLKKELRIK